MTVTTSKLNVNKMIKKYSKYFAILCLLTPVVFIFFPLAIYNKILVILLWHMIISIPVLFIISKKGEWNKTVQNSMAVFRYYDNPFFMLTLATGLIYPLLWGFFLSLSRYFRLGKIYDIYLQVNYFIDYFFLLIFIWPCIFIWLYLLFKISHQIKNSLWNYTESLGYSLHLGALQYYDYFHLCKLIYKSHFIMYDLIFMYPGSFYRHFDDNIKIPLFVIISSKIKSPYFFVILHISVISTMIIEIIINNGAFYYGLYTLFIYPTILGIINTYHIIGQQKLILNMCFSDYLSLNFENPRYYLKFWFYAKNPQLWYGFEHKLPQNLLTIYNKTIILEVFNYSRFTRFHNKLPYYVHGYKAIPAKSRKELNTKNYGIKIRNAQPLNIRIAAYYKCQYGVRWFHTTRILYSPTKNVLHAFTGKFIKDKDLLLTFLNKPFYIIFIA